MKDIKVGVFYSKNHSSWKLLPEVSSFLSEKGLVPNVGDRITAFGGDHKVMDISEADFANCVTVNEKVFKYKQYDVALICDYKPF